MSKVRVKGGKNNICAFCKDTLTGATWTCGCYNRTLHMECARDIKDAGCSCDVGQAPSGALYFGDTSEPVDPCLTRRSAYIPPRTGPPDLPEAVIPDDIRALWGVEMEDNIAHCPQPFGFIPPEAATPRMIGTRKSYPASMMTGLSAERYFEPRNQARLDRIDREKAHEETIGKKARELQAQMSFFMGEGREHYEELRHLSSKREIAPGLMEKIQAFRIETGNNISWRMEEFEKQLIRDMKEAEAEVKKSENDDRVSRDDRIMAVVIWTIFIMIVELGLSTQVPEVPMAAAMLVILMPVWVGVCIAICGSD